MDEQPKVKGPASYFPAIEQKYGQPIAHWLTLLAGREERKHMALVCLLKDGHPIGNSRSLLYHCSFRRALRCVYICAPDGYPTYRIRTHGI
ncbi:DUF4287 domain-containing protein, partial [Aeromonas caviae]|uniref:DUF4287 domain-containing protein n=1 Tax=Aeromonas caviae TaxID=648 RepID=UPI0025B6B416